MSGPFCTSLSGDIVYDKFDALMAMNQTTFMSMYEHRIYQPFDY